MASLTLQPGIEETILKLGDRVELRDLNGEVVGYFVSPTAYRKLLYTHANSLVTDSELEASRNQAGGRTTAEVLERLKSLERG